MTGVIQSLIDAVALGALYALVAVGIALVFGVLRLVNFAHSELITAGGLVLAITSDWPLPVSIALCLLAPVALALLTERVAFRPLRGASPATMLVTTFAVAFALQAVWLTAFGPEGQSADVLGPLNRTVFDGDIAIRWVTLIELVGGGLILGALVLLLTRTDIGLQMRAAAADAHAARLLGVRANRVIAVAFALAGLLAGVVALLLTVQQPLVGPTFGLQITILALVGVVVGGMDRLVSATAKPPAVGFATSILGSVLSADNRVFLPSFVFLLVIIVLLVRPAGLFAPLRATNVERV
jgi:branched-chain amino acid transport system permease protein